MKYADFVQIMSNDRMSRYLTACSGDTKKAMTLYWLNLKLSQEAFTLISCFEVSLRNLIDRHYSNINGDNWLRDSCRSGGIFTSHRCRKTRKIISQACHNLGANYSHSKLVTEMDFGFWRYLFAQPQYYAGGQSLLEVFPSKPISSITFQYNQTYVFNELKQINDLRNRIAHHEPICFRLGAPIIDSDYIENKYQIVINLMNWMGLRPSQLLFGLDHIDKLVLKLNALMGRKSNP